MPDIVEAVIRVKELLEGIDVSDTDIKFTAVDIFSELLERCNLLAFNELQLERIYVIIANKIRYQELESEILNSSNGEIVSVGDTSVRVGGDRSKQLEFQKERYDTLVSDFICGNRVMGW